MISIDYLPINPDEVPIQKIFTIGDKTYKFDFWYNSENDFYTVYIKDMLDNILYSTRLTYGSAIVNAVVSGLDIPYQVFPFNFNQLFTSIILGFDSVKKENLDTSVRLYINNGVFV